MNMNSLGTGVALIIFAMTQVPLGIKNAAEVAWIDKH